MIHDEYFINYFSCHIILGASDGLCENAHDRFLVTVLDENSLHCRGLPGENPDPALGDA